MRGAGFLAVCAAAWVLPTDAHADPRCQTPAALAAFHRGQALFAGRPDDVGFVDSAVYPIRVHYRQVDDAERAANLVLPAVETSWQVEIDQMGWPAPPPDAGVGGDDRYDVYMTNDGTFGGAYTFGFGSDVTPDDDWYSVPSYIALDDRFITDADMLIFVSHEFNHALQYTIDAWEIVLFPWESTAEAMSDLVDDAADSYDYEVWDFNALPFASILFDGYMQEITDYDNFSYYEYGGIVFGDFLEERYGTKDGTTLLKLWDDLAQPERTQEPDFLDALALVDPSAPSAAGLYTEFATWRMFSGPRDDGAHFEEATLWGTKGAVRVDQTLALADVDGAQLVPLVLPYELGTSYFEIVVDDGTGGTEDTLHAEVTGDAEVQWGLVWAVWPTAGGPAATGSVLAAPGALAAVDVPLAGGATAMIGVVNGGRVDLEGEENDVHRHAFTLALDRVEANGTTPPPPTTTGGTPPTTPPGTDPTDGDPATPGTGDEEAPGGCGCASRSGRGLLTVGFLAGLAARRGRGYRGRPGGGDGRSDRRGVGPVDSGRG